MTSSYSPIRKKTSSRLTRKEQKKLTQQTFIFVVAAILVIIIFIFLIIPGVIRLFFKMLDKNANFDSNDKIPPQIPVIEAPVTATYSASLNLSGFGEAESEIVFILNGTEINRLNTDNEGKFSYDILLEDGENLIDIYGVDQAGNESMTKTYTIERDSEAPVIDILEPADGASIELRKNQLVTIKGNTEAQAKVYINGRMIYAKTDGSFATRFQLNEGENQIKFEVIDKAGNRSEREITVHFKL